MKDKNKETTFVGKQEKINPKNMAALDEKNLVEDSVMATIISENFDQESVIV